MHATSALMIHDRQAYLGLSRCLRGEVLDIDTWVGSSGKNGMRRDWLIRGRNSGDVFVRATRQASLVLPTER